MDDDRDLYDQDDDYEPTLLERMGWRLAGWRYRVARWYRRTFHRKAWDAEQAAKAAERAISTREFDEAMRRAYPPEMVNDLAKPHPLLAHLKRTDGEDFKP